MQRLPSGRLDVMALCQIFTSLVGQLSHPLTLHCIIDGISDFDTVLGGWARDMDIVMDCFRDITMRLGGQQRYQRAAAVKILLGSSEMSTGIYGFLDGDQVIDLSAGHMYGQEVTPGVLIEALQSQVSPVPWESSIIETQSQYSGQSTGSLEGRFP